MDKERFPEWYVDVKSLSPNWVTENFLNFMDLSLEDCKEKNITSIWWWFWIFEMDAARAWATVTAVDPIFSDKESIELKLKENKKWLDDKTKWDFVNWVETTKNNIASLLLECDDAEEKYVMKDRLAWYQARQTEINEYLRRRKILLKHLDSWEEEQVKNGLILNPSSWDYIEWIGTGSQDIVVIWHTLSHIHKGWSKINGFLEEALRILKNGWRVWIIDYVWDNKEFEEILKESETKKYYREVKWSFVCCFDRDWLKDFIEKELW